jgi:SNF2 family DNA or RNA helicase
LEDIRLKFDALAKLQPPLKKRNPRFLVITLKSVKVHWWNHIDNHVPYLRPYFTVVHWAELTEAYHAPCTGDKLNTCVDGYVGYPVSDMRIKCAVCKGRGWNVRYRPNKDLARGTYDFVIADEAHVVTGRKTLRRKALKALKTKHLRLLTATPNDGKPDKMWTLLNLMYPKDFRSYWKFFEEYVEYHYDYANGGATKYRVIDGPKNTAKFRAMIAPYFIKRPPDIMGLTVLPPTIREVELDPKQQRAYDEMKKRSEAWIGEFEDQYVAAPIAIAQMTRLVQFASAHCEIINGKVRMSEPSSKLDEMMLILEGTNEPVVVFTESRQLVDLASARLVKSDISHFCLHGGVPDSERNNWQRFQAGERRVFVCNMETGGFGIDLFRASLCIYIERSWKPLNNQQSLGRLARTGQKNAVRPIYIYAKGTVDYRKRDVNVWKVDNIKRMLG